MDRDEVQRVPGFRFNTTFREVVTQHGVQGALGVRQRLTELPVDGKRWRCSR
jgi:hypothetical protein